MALAGCGRTPEMLADAAVAAAPDIAACTGPMVRSITIAKPAASPGDTIQVIVDTGCTATIAVFGTFVSPDGVGFLPLWCTQEGALWQGSIDIARDASCGVWRLRELHVVDRSTNRLDLDTTNPIVAGSVFSVSRNGAVCDATPPVVQSVTVSPQSVSNSVDTKVTVTIGVTDIGSGVMAVNGRADGPIPPGGGSRPFFWFPAAPATQAPDSPWQAIVRIPMYAAKGTWQIDYLQVSDNADNIVNYMDTSMPPLLGATFQVQ
jgi:hypothetical protein